jgi:hypothetical protein
VLKKTITYENFNDETVTEDHYFHLSMAEITEMELSHADGLSTALQRIVDAEDGKGIVETIQGIILKAYGKRSPDGRRFSKSEEIRNEFMETGAYSELFMELATNAQAAAEFVNGLVPKGMAEKIKTLLAEQGAEKAKTDASTGDPKLAAVPDEDVKMVRVITSADIVAMSHEDLEKAKTELQEGTARILDERNPS